MASMHGRRLACWRVGWSLEARSHPHGSCWWPRMAMPATPILLMPPALPARPPLRSGPAPSNPVLDGLPWRSRQSGAAEALTDHGRGQPVASQWPVARIFRGARGFVQSMVASVGLRPLRSFCFTLISDTPTLSLPARPLPSHFNPPVSHSTLFRTSQHSRNFLQEHRDLHGFEGGTPIPISLLFSSERSCCRLKPRPSAFTSSSASEISSVFPFARSIPATPHRQNPGRTSLSEKLFCPTHRI